jgi:tetratricopeptide (TPR) repeat protein
MYIAVHGTSFIPAKRAMQLQQLWIPCLVCLGCQSLAAVEPVAQLPRTEKAQQLWEQGQRAMQQGQSDQAIALYQQSLETEPQQGQNHLSLAAAYLSKGDDRAACEHLGLFLQAHPDHRNARFYHAELLLKLDRPREARGEFEGTIRREQLEREPDVRHLVQCHSRLVQIGEVLGDGYQQHLNRGIAMLLLAQQRAALDDPGGELSTESLLCKAAAELARARAMRPWEARPFWYLHTTWRQLAQHQPARQCLGEALRRAPSADLTPAERGDLLLVCRERLGSHSGALPR